MCWGTVGETTGTVRTGLSTTTVEKEEAEEGVIGVGVTGEVTGVETKGGRTRGRGGHGGRGYRVDRVFTGG